MPGVITAIQTFGDRILYANVHRGKVKKAGRAAFPLPIVEEELRRIPRRGWAAMICKVYEVDPLYCPRYMAQ